MAQGYGYAAPPAIVCVRCHAPLMPAPGYATVQCPQCGNVSAVPMMAPATPPTLQVYEQRAKCTRTVYVLLAIFLGVLGVHNFVAGRTRQAVGQLLVTLCIGWLFVPLLFVWLWILIEIVTVTTDGEGARM